MNQAHTVFARNLPYVKVKYLKLMLCVLLSVDLPQLKALVPALEKLARILTELLNNCSPLAFNEACCVEIDIGSPTTYNSIPSID